MRLLLSWLRDFVDVSASAEEIAATLALRGFEVASIEAAPDHLPRAPWFCTRELACEEEARPVNAPAPAKKFTHRQI